MSRGRQVQVFRYSTLQAEADLLPASSSSNWKQIWQEAVSAEAAAPRYSQTDVASRLRRAVHRQSLTEGKRAHFYIVSFALDQNLLLGNLLVQMYGFSGALQDAKASFSRMHHRDASSWSLLIKSYARYAYLDQALCLFSQMQTEIMSPDNASIGSLLSVCSGKDDLSLVRLVHSFIVESSLIPTVTVSTALLSIYGKSGCLQDSELIFNSLRERDVVCWNAMIASFVAEKENIKAFCLYSRMILEDFEPDRSTFLSILTGCAGQNDLLEGRLIHNSVIYCALESDIGIANALVNMYGDCDSLKDSQSVFDQISVANVVSWNSMIDGLVRNGRFEDALQLFEKMQRKSVSPSNVTFINVLSACSSPVFLEQGQLLYHFIICHGLECDVVILNSLVSMYGKCGEVGDAKVAFEKSQPRDRVSWTSMLTIYASYEQESEVSQVFEQMQIEGVVPDRITYISMSVAFADKVLLPKCKKIHACILSSNFVSDVNLDNSLITMYGKCGSAVYAEKIFTKMRKRDLTSWNAMFSACLQNGLTQQALRLLSTMGCENILPDKFLCSTIISACANATSQEKGRHMHTYAVLNAFDSDLTVGNSILNMYGKFGNLEDAFRVFEKMAKRDIVSWSAVIGAFAQQGEGKTAVSLYNKMIEEGVASDKVALVHLLSACSHGGFVDEGLRHFLALVTDTNGEIIVDHVNCLVDLLTRAGRLEEAEQFLSKLPSAFSAVAWTTLLGACRSQIDVKRGEYAASRVFELDPKECAPHVTLSNLYFAAGKVDEALQVIKRMKYLGLGKGIDNATFDVLSTVSDDTLASKGVLEE